MSDVVTYAELTGDGEEYLWGLEDQFAEGGVFIDGFEGQVVEQLAEEEWSSFGVKVVEVEDTRGEVYEVELEPWHWRVVTY